MSVAAKARKVAAPVAAAGVAYTWAATPDGEAGIAAEMTPPTVAVIVVPSTFTPPTSEEVARGNLAGGKVPNEILAALVVSVVADGANATPAVFATTGLG